MCDLKAHLTVDGNDFSSCGKQARSKERVADSEMATRRATGHIKEAWTKACPVKDHTPRSGSASAAPTLGNRDQVSYMQNLVWRNTRFLTEKYMHA